eukprot:scaffold257080_cov22-Tisochrysis_lutea.AAC.1
MQLKPWSCKTSSLPLSLPLGVIKEGIQTAMAVRMCTTFVLALTEPQHPHTQSFWASILEGVINLVYAILLGVHLEGCHPQHPGPCLSLKPCTPLIYTTPSASRSTPQPQIMDTPLLLNSIEPQHSPTYAILCIYSSMPHHCRNIIPTLRLLQHSPWVTTLHIQHTSSLPQQPTATPYFLH